MNTASLSLMNDIACKQWLWPVFFLGPDLLDQDHLLRNETGPGRPGPLKKNAPFIVCAVIKANTIVVVVSDA